MRARLVGREGIVAHPIRANSATDIATAGWATIDSIDRATSDADFCRRCHSMTIMVDTYLQDAHGGINATGVAAACNDCHLPHAAAVEHLVTKVQTGLHDIWAELTYDIDEIDWMSKRDDRAHYVYDSGCLRCHSRLEEAATGNLNARSAHEPFRLGRSTRNCVSCHPGVGHSNLADALRTLAEPR